MKIGFRKSFARDLKRIREKHLLKRVEEVIQEIEVAESTLEIKNLKKLKAEGRYYCIKIKDYRIGLIIKGDIVIFVRFCIEEKSIVIFRNLANAEGFA